MMLGKIRTIGLGLCLAWGTVSGVSLAEEVVETVSPQLLENGTQFYGIAGGGVYGTRFYSDQATHELALLQIYFGQVTSEPWWSGKWYAGSWSIAGELDLGYHYREGTSTLAGAAIIGRYILGGEGRWHPFLSGGVGANWTDIGGPDLGGNFQFSPQVGTGMYWFFNTTLAATFEYRFVHYSNGGLRLPNGGINANAFLVGFSIFH